MKVVPSYLLLQLATTITIKKSKIGQKAGGADSDKSECDQTREMQQFGMRSNKKEVNQNEIKHTFQ
jgi:hypothetical protein